MKEKRWILFSEVCLAILVSGLMLTSPKIAEAACGASTSSCKTCHEVQGKLPVNQTGAWHTQHAFGDFCQACHLGNASETDMTKAHVGVIKNPLTQPDQTCASCHPSDTAARVAKYGGSTGTSVSSSATTQTSASVGSSSPAPAAAATQTPVTSQPSTAATQTPPNMNPNFDVIDFNRNFQSPISVWTIVFSLADLVILLVLVVLLWRWQKGIWLWQYFQRRSANEHLVNLEREAPEIRDIFYKLRDCEAKTVTAVEALLNRGREGQRLLQTVAGLSPELLDKLQSLPEAELELIIRLSRATRSEGGRQNDD